MPELAFFAVCAQINLNFLLIRFLARVRLSNYCTCQFGIRARTKLKQGRLNLSNINSFRSLFAYSSIQVSFASDDVEKFQILNCLPKLLADAMERLLLLISEIEIIPIPVPVSRSFKIRAPGAELLSAALLEHPPATNLSLNATLRPVFSFSSLIRI